MKTAQIEDGFNENIIQRVVRELKEHRRSILCGDDECSLWWGDKLRELQRQTVISGLQARAMFPKAPSSTPQDAETDETVDRLRQGALFYSVAAGRHSEKSALSLKRTLSYR
jgi:hypothetical protein